MKNIRVKFLGSGDAFGSGGRFHTCIQVRSAGSSFLIDCGASAMVAMRRFGVDPNTIDTILLTHLHGDHFGGIPFFILDAQLVSKRSTPLTIAGPQGVRDRITLAMEALFPGSSGVQQKFALEMVEMEPGNTSIFNGFSVTPYPVCHPSGAPALALRIECMGKIVTYTGDTEWTDVLIPAAGEADLLIAESYFFDKKVRFHLDFKTLAAHLDQINPKRLIVTHMGKDMLGQVDRLPCEHAEDGMEINL